MNKNIEERWPLNSIAFIHLFENCQSETKKKNKLGFATIYKTFLCPSPQTTVSSNQSQLLYTRCGAPYAAVVVERAKNTIDHAADNTVWRAVDTLSASDFRDIRDVSLLRPIQDGGANVAKFLQEARDV